MARSPIANKTFSTPIVNHRGTRSPNPIKWIVIHSAVCCDGSTSGAENLGLYLQNGAGGRRVSWHYSTDQNTIVSSLDEEKAGRHSGSQFVDMHSIAIEMAAQVPGKWETDRYKKMLTQTAKLVADISQRLKIPTEPLTAHQLRSGHHGVISHNLSRIVFGGTTHTDPGPGFPWEELQKQADELKHQVLTPPAPSNPNTTNPAATGALAVIEMVHPLEWVEACYKTYLGRAGTYKEHCRWVQNIEGWTQQTAEDIRWAIQQSPESKQRGN